MKKSLKLITAVFAALTIVSCNKFNYPMQSYFTFGYLEGNINEIKAPEIKFSTANQYVADCYAYILNRLGMSTTQNYGYRKEEFSVAALNLKTVLDTLTVPAPPDLGDDVTINVEMSLAGCPIGADVIQVISRKYIVYPQKQEVTKE